MYYISSTVKVIWVFECVWLHSYSINQASLTTYYLFHMNTHVKHVTKPDCWEETIMTDTYCGFITEHCLIRYLQCEMPRRIENCFLLCATELIQFSLDKPAHRGLDGRERLTGLDPGCGSMFCWVKCLDRFWGYSIRLIGTSKYKISSSVRSVCWDTERLTVM